MSILLTIMPARWSACFLVVISRLVIAISRLDVAQSTAEDPYYDISDDEPRGSPRFFPPPILIDVEKAAANETWLNYKHHFNLLNQPEFVNFNYEHLARTVFVEKLKMMRAKNRCKPNLADEPIKVDGNWWRPQSPPWCDCGHEGMEQNRHEQYRRYYYRPAYSRLGPWFGHSEYDFRKWIYVFRLRQEEFKRCNTNSTEWPEEMMGEGADEPLKFL